MADIAMCSNEQCIKRNECYRFTAVVNPYRQAYVEFKPVNNTQESFECRGWWDNKAMYPKTK